MNDDATTHFLSLPLATREAASAIIAIHTDTLMSGVNKAPLWEKGLKNQTAVHRTSSAAVARNMATQRNKARHLVSCPSRVSLRTQIQASKKGFPYVRSASAIMVTLPMFATLYEGGSEAGTTDMACSLTKSGDFAH